MCSCFCCFCCVPPQWLNIKRAELVWFEFVWIEVHRIASKLVTRKQASACRVVYSRRLFFFGGGVGFWLSTLFFSLFVFSRFLWFFIARLPAACCRYVPGIYPRYGDTSRYIDFGPYLLCCLFSVLLLQLIIVVRYWHPPYVHADTFLGIGKNTAG